MNDRAKLIRQVHVLAYSRLKLTEEEYRLIVETVTHETSVKDLPASEIEKVLVALRRIPMGELGGHHADGAGRQHSIALQQRLIAHLMEYLAWNWASTASFCKRITGKDDTRSCTSAELRKLIRGMIAIIEQNIASGKLTLTNEQQVRFKRMANPHQRQGAPR